MKYIYELILGNYARCTYLFQSTRSRKFVSDMIARCIVWNKGVVFQSPRSGEFVSDPQRTNIQNSE